MSPRGSPEASPWRPVAANAAIMMLSLLLCLVALEVAVRALGLRTAAIVRRVEDVDPEREIAFLPGAHSVYETPEFRFEVRTNSHGRRDREWDAATLASPEAILLVGDSVAFGYGVDAEHALAARLERRFAAAGRPREVFDFTMPAAGPREYRELVEEARRLGIAARTVILAIFIGNDFYVSALDPPPPPGPDPARRPPPPRFRSHLLAFLRHRVSSSPRVVGWILRLGGALGITVYDTGGSYIFLRDPTPEQERAFQEILHWLGAIARELRTERRQPHLVVFPNKIQVENAEALTSSIYDATRPNRRILAYCREIELPCLDLLPVLAGAHRAGGDLFFSIDRHLTAEGLAVAEAAIAEHLERHPP